MNPLVQRYLDHARFEKRLAERTLTLYQQSLAQLTELAAGAIQVKGAGQSPAPVQENGSNTTSSSAHLNWSQIQPAHIRRWAAQWHSPSVEVKRHKIQNGHSSRSVALMLSAWRGFFDWLCRERLIACNPVQAVRAPKSAKLLPKALGVDDAVQLAEFKNQNVVSVAANPLSSAAGTSPWLEARDVAIVELLYGCGIRVGELVGLDCAFSAAAKDQGRGWVDLANAEIHVFGKGRKRRQLPLGRQAALALQAWLKVRRDLIPPVPEGVEDLNGAEIKVQNALFIGQRGTRLTPQAVWQRLRQRSLQAGLAAPVHPHMLRHSFASHVLQSSGDLRAVQELMGHASISSTQVYTGLDFQHLAKVYDAAHPRAHKKP
jgi:integrase/recombinase XerC